MAGIFSRTEMLLGADAMKKLAASRVAIFGVGGVGGHAMEALARSGVGAIDLIDHDIVDETNLNRQIITTREVIGRSKVEVAAERIASINPDCKVTVHDIFYLPCGTPDLEPGNAVEQGGTVEPSSEAIDFTDYDYVVDAIDTVAGKLGLIEAARAAGTPIICSMGAGNKLDASAFKVADIYDTRVCPLAKVIRRECRKRGIESLKVVYSEEEPKRPYALETSKGLDTGETLKQPMATVSPKDEPDERQLDKAVPIPESASNESGIEALPVNETSDVPTRRKVPPGSVAFAPAVAGLIMAGEVVRDLSGRR